MKPSSIPPQLQPQVPPVTMLSAPQSRRPAPPERTKQEAPNPAIQVLHYVRVHLPVILFCGALLGVGLAYAAYQLMPPKYESYALLLVASSPNSIAASNDPRGKSDFATYINTTKVLIKSDFVLNSALNDAKYRLSDLPTIQAQKNPVKYLEEKLTILASEQSEVIRISLEGDKPEDIRKIVDAVKDAYYREVVEKEIDQKTNFKHQVERAKTSIQDLMKTKTIPPTSRESILALAPKPTPPAEGGEVVVAGGIVIPEVPGVPNIQRSTGLLPAAAPATTAAIIALSESETMKRARAELLFKRISQAEIDLQQFPILIQEKLSEAERLKQEADATSRPVPTAESLAAAERDPEVAAKLAQAEQKQRDYQLQLSVVRDPNSDAMRRKKKEADELANIAEILKLERATMLETARLRSKSQSLFDAYETTRREVDRLRERERLMRKVYEDDKQELAAMPPELKKPEEKGPLVDPEKTDLLTHDDYYRRLTGQVIGLDLELKSPPRVRKLQDASLPMPKDGNKQILATIAAGLMGFVVVGAGLVGYESRIKKVCSLQEVKTAQPLPVLGVVPWLADTSTLNDPLKRADILESLDKLRAVVSQTWHARGVRTIAVTSPLTDEGKSFTAYGLALSFAQAGYRTLLVDFDLRNPSLHTYAGVPNVDGVCELLQAEAEADADPCRHQILLPNGLLFLPAGCWSDQIRRSAVGGKLERLLGTLGEQVEFLILHGHGLLSVAESIEIVRRCDAVLLCSMYRETRLPLLRRASERLNSLETRHAGIVYHGASKQEALC